MRYVIPRSLSYVVGEELDPADPNIYLVRLPDGHPVVLKGSAATIWLAAAEGSHDPVATVAEAYGVDPDSIRDDVLAFVTDALAQGLLAEKETDV